MLRAKGGGAFFSNRLCNRNTVEFLGIWEQLNNPNSNCAEFDKIKSRAGLNSFLVFRHVPSIKSIASWQSKVSDKQEMEKTGVRGRGWIKNKKDWLSEAADE